MLWKQITATLVDQLAQGRFKPGDRFYTLKELGKEYRVSDITGRRIMEELSALNLIDCIQGKGTFVRRTVIGRTIKLLLHTSLSQAGYSHLYLVQEILRGIQDAAQLAGCQALMVSTEHFADHVQEHDLVATLWHSRHADAMRLAVERGARIACTHAPEPVVGVHTVRPDFAAGTALATQHLLDLGHRRIALVTGPISNVWFSARFDGYYRTLKAAGIPCDLDLVCETAIENGCDIAPAFEALRSGSTPPTAVVCANDGRALAFMRLCREHGVRIPQDLAIVGFDNMHDGALVTPALTTVDQFWRRQGSEAVALLLRQGELAPGGAIEDIVLQPQLVKRDTT
jgi:DNA-binding LacI/PurR family transcriptional regulator